MTVYKCIACPFQGVVDGATADAWTCPKCGRHYEMQRPSPAVANPLIDDIPTLVARLEAWSSDERLGDGMLLRHAAAALSRLSRALAERDAERDAAQKAMSYASNQAHLEWTRAQKAERERDEARAALAEQAKHDCDDWLNEGMGCALCNHTAIALREAWSEDPVRKERDALRLELDTLKAHMLDSEIDRRFEEF